MTKLATVGLIALTLGYSGVQAQMMQNKGGARGEHSPITKLLSQIELSDAQKATLETLAASFKEERQASRKAGNKTQDLAAAISESGLDVTLFTQSAQENFTARTATHAQHLKQIIDVLTPAQRLELKTLLETRAAKKANKIKDLGY